jgi:hypothetical protein
MAELERSQACVLRSVNGTGASPQLAPLDDYHRNSDAVEQLALRVQTLETKLPQQHDGCVTLGEIEYVRSSMDNFHATIDEFRNSLESVEQRGVKLDSALQSNSEEFVRYCCQQASRLEQIEALMRETSVLINKVELATQAQTQTQAHPQLHMTAALCSELPDASMVRSLDFKLSSLSQVFQTHALSAQAGIDDTKENVAELREAHEKLRTELERGISRGRLAQAGELPGRCDRLELSAELHGGRLVRLEQEVAYLRSCSDQKTASEGLLTSDALRRLGDIEARCHDGESSHDGIAARHGAAITDVARRLSDLETNRWQGWRHDSERYRSTERSERLVTRSCCDVESRLQQLEQRFLTQLQSIAEPLEEALCQLVSGLCKMAQLIGVTAEDASDKGSWRSACADFPRIMQHAWLRLRLPRSASLLKILRQKVDADTVRELQSQMEALEEAVAVLAEPRPSPVRGFSVMSPTGARTCGSIHVERPKVALLVPRPSHAWTSRRARQTDESACFRPPMYHETAHCED